MFVPVFRLVGNAVKSFRFATSSATAACVMSNPENFKEAKSIYEFSARNIKGEQVNLDKYKGHVCIIVNVASRCGYTKNNYAELVELFDQYHETKGLCVLGMFIYF